MLIIIEGPPSTRKTSLAHHLRSVLKALDTERDTALLAGHHGSDPYARGEAYVRHFTNRLANYVPGGDKHVICDEWHWAHGAYGWNLMARHLQINLLDYVDAMLCRLGAVIVHMDADVPTIRRRMRRKNPWLQVSARIDIHLEGIREEYTRLAHRAITTVLPPQMPVADIIASAKHAEEQITKTFAAYPLYIGPQRPKLLVVDADHTNPTRSFFPANSSGYAYLHRSLQNSALPHTSGLHEVGLLNVAGMTDIKTKNIVGHLRKPKVVALGLLTSTHLGTLGIGHVAIPHPAAVRARHHGHYLDEYGQLLRDSAGEDDGTSSHTWNPGPPVSSPSESESESSPALLADIEEWIREHVPTTGA